MSARPDGRAPDELRPVRIRRNAAPAAAGSVLISVGNTQVLCAVTVQDGVPRWMREQGVNGGWLSAEYSLLPYATSERTRREATSGRLRGRTQEIQRMIGRCLRAVSDLEALGTRTVWVDCDVIQADGGTRTAAVTGACVAYRLAMKKLVRQGVLEADPVRECLAAVSVGVVGGRTVLDLDYEEDSAAEVDMNVVMTASGRFVEIQGTAEGDPFSRRRLGGMLELARRGVEILLEKQRKALGER